MNQPSNIIIAGAGGIASAAGLILAEWSKVSPIIFIGNRTLEKAQKVAQWIKEGCTKPVAIKTFHLPEKGSTHEIDRILNESDALLDCLPGSLAPKMALLAKDFHLHYANLTEYVTETDEIIKLAENADTGFVLQTGLAPGYIDVLAHKLFIDFCKEYKVNNVDILEFKVGALTNNAVAPHYYGFTWSPVGVATEYIKDAVVLRAGKKVYLPALSERADIIIQGFSYEEDLTSGGTANLPDALTGKVQTLDYKTLRYPGHYNWVASQLKKLKGNKDIIGALQQIMESQIPRLQNDQIILYAAVEGKDSTGTLRRHEVAKQIPPQQVGKHTLRAIQTTTAAPLLQSVQWLLQTKPKGVILQSQIDPEEFLNGNFISPVYGTV